MNDHFRGVRNMISDTPRTQARVRYMIDNNISPEGLEHWANGLERELNAANERTKRLEEENDAMRADLLLWHEQEVKP